MELKILLLAVTTLVTTAAAQQGDGNTAGETNLGCRQVTQRDPNEKCYTLVAEVQTHQDALEICQNRFGGQLARIPDVFTCSYLKAKINERFPRNVFVNFWIGAKYDMNQWVWTGEDNNRVTYSYWAGGQPVNREGRCVFVDRSPHWFWKTENCNERKYFMCEYSNCGRPVVDPVSHHRVLVTGGSVARLHGWPWMVTLQDEQGHQCGGSLISNRWVLSAAHCVKRFRASRERKAILGVHDLRETRTASAITVEIADWKIAPYFNDTTKSNDVMLVKLERSIRFSNAIKPVCLPRQSSTTNDAPPGRLCYATGWGETLDTSVCCPMWVAKRNTELIGSISTLDEPIGSLYDCQYQCFRNRNCIGINFRLTPSRRCEILTSYTTESPNTSGVDCYVIRRECTDCKFAWTIYENQSVAGSAIVTSDASSLNECQQDCLLEDQCTSFTYRYQGGADDGRCTLLNNPSRESMTPSTTTNTFEKTVFFRQDKLDVLRQVAISIIDQSTCENSWRDNGGVDASLMCSGRLSGGADTCGGDSGGPLVCKETDGRWVVYGVTSYGSTECGRANQPGVYAIVARHRDWIERTLRNG